MGLTARGRLRLQAAWRWGLLALGVALPLGLIGACAVGLIQEARNAPPSTWKAGDCFRLPGGTATGKVYKIKQRPAVYEIHWYLPGESKVNSASFRSIAEVDRVAESVPCW